MADSSGFPVLGSVLGLITGAAKYASDQSASQQDRRERTAVARFSPWTKIKPPEQRHADPFGSALKYGATGALLDDKNGLTGKAKKTIFGDDNGQNDPGAAAQLSDAYPTPALDALGAGSADPSSSRWASALPQLQAKYPGVDPDQLKQLFDAYPDQLK